VVRGENGRANCPEGISATGKPIQANRVQALVSKMFSFAVDADLLPANPCVRLRKRASEEARRRVLSDAEIALFWHRITKRPVSRRVGLALHLVLLTGVRVTEMAGAELKEFAHLDGNQATWSIPPARSCGAAFLDGTGDRERAGRHCQHARRGVGEASGQPWLPLGFSWYLRLETTNRSMVMRSRLLWLGSAKHSI
jgi:hypothetical protein